MDMSKRVKSFTSLEQSKKLAKILPLESADMCYRYYSGGMITGYGDCILAKSFITGRNVIRENDLPCWSLAALLGVLPDYTLQDNPDGTVFVVSEKEKPIMSDDDDNPVDACYELILKLHELNLL
jgi:hypothetical protein